MSIRDTASKLLNMSDQKLMEYQDRYNDIFFEEVRELARHALKRPVEPPTETDHTFSGLTRDS